MPKGLSIYPQNLLDAGWVPWKADAKLIVSKLDIYSGTPLGTTAMQPRETNSRLGRGRSQAVPVSQQRLQLTPPEP